jgi:hypothetical protein
MPYACQVLGHYFSLSMYLYKRDDGQQEWRQECCRFGCRMVRTANPNLRTDTQEAADLYGSPFDRYSMEWDR